MMRSRSDHVWLLVVLAVTALVAIPTLVLPPGRDQAIYLLVGRIAAEGGALYRDAFDFKPPGILLLHAALWRIAPGILTAGRWLDLASLLLGIVALTHLLRPEGRTAAVAGGLFHGTVLLLSFRYWDLGQPEGHLATAVLVGLLAFRASRSLPFLAFISGLAFGGAIVLKYPAVLFVPLVGLLAADSRWTRSGGTEPGSGRGRRIGAGLGLVALGVVVAVGAVLVALLPGGALGAWIEIQRDYVPGYTELLLASGWETAIRESLRLALDFLLSRPAWLVAPLLAVPVVLRWGSGPARLLPVAGIVLGTIGVLAQGKLFHYHWVPVLPFVSLAVGHAAGILIDRTRAGTWPRHVVPLGYGVILASVVLSGRATWTERYAAVEHLLGRTDRAAFHRSPAFGFPGEGDHALAATEEAAAVVAAHTAPLDRIFVWGFEPLLYLVADRPAASRFIYNAPFLSPWCPRPWIDELLAGLGSDPPRAIVVVANDAIPWVTGVPLSSAEALRYFPDLVTLLRTRYEPAAEVEDFTLFTRVDRIGEAP